MDRIGGYCERAVIICRQRGHLPGPQRYPDGGKPAYRERGRTATGHDVRYTVVAKIRRSQILGAESGGANEGDA